jgi:succinate-semialdehyde dehydrogenase/glutarate-semialdehyde dehydrogenase
MAGKVQPDWASQSPNARAKALLRWRRELVSESEQLTKTLSRENGKPLHEAWLHELAPLCDFITWLANEAAQLLANRTLALRWLKQQKSVLLSKPRGQCAIISPYNFPMLIPFADAAAALVAGCSVVIKPSEHTPLTAIAIAKLAHASGLEPALLQVLPGGPDVARALIDAPVDEVIFTGNLEHGRDVARRCADKLLPCTLELGGKASLLVLEDASLDDAASAIVFGALANSGQSCIAVERVLAHTRVHRRLVDAVVDRVRMLRQGDPSLAEVDLGALTSPHQLKHVISQVNGAIAQGAKLLCGGRRSPEVGHFFAPTVLDYCTNQMSVVSEESFGPVIPIVPIDSMPEGLAIANSGASGLAAYLFGRDEDMLTAIAGQLHAGHVLLNDVLWSYTCPEIPFGGRNQSGWGVVHGSEGLRSHTREVHLGSSRFKVPESLGLGFPYSKRPRTLLKQALRLFTR